MGSTNFWQRRRRRQRRMTDGIFFFALNLFFRYNKSKNVEKKQFFFFDFPKVKPNLSHISYEESKKSGIAKTFANYKLDSSC
jgi:hypothetical protein